MGMWAIMAAPLMISADLRNIWITSRDLSWVIIGGYSLFQLILGNFGLSYEQERVQMGMWGILTAPLMISADLRTSWNTS